MNLEARKPGKKTLKSISSPGFLASRFYFNSLLGLLLIAEECGLKLVGLCFFQCIQGTLNLMCVPREAYGKLLPIRCSEDGITAMYFLDGGFARFHCLYLFSRFEVGMYPLAR